jgi:hypothetical protein
VARLIDTLGFPLLAVACPATNDCVASDLYGRALSFDPSLQSGHSSARLPDANALLGVACATTQLCVAVDDVGHAYFGVRANPPAAPRGAATAGRPKVSGKTVEVEVSCSSTGPCAVTAALSVTEKLRGRKVVAVAATATKRKVIAAGQQKMTLKPAKQSLFKVRLNHAALKLLARFRRLPAKLMVTQKGAKKTVESRTVTVKAKARTKRRRNP